MGEVTNRNEHEHEFRLSVSADGHGALACSCGAMRPADVDPEADYADHERGGEMAYVIQGTVVTHTEVEGSGATMEEAMQAWRDNGGRGTPDWVHRGDPDKGKDVVGLCESCQGPILEGQPREYDEDGIEWHTKCPDHHLDHGDHPDAD